MALHINENLYTLHTNLRIFVNKWISKLTFRPIHETAQTSRKFQNTLNVFAYCMWSCDRRAKYQELPSIIQTVRGSGTVKMLVYENPYMCILPVPVASTQQNRTA